ncbi:MAG: hypothetical protein VYB76_07660, partial [Chloroflexota bacterium]|nr:hypothetical protein [Chloroflexota bacterium]
QSTVKFLVTVIGFTACLTYLHIVQFTVLGGLLDASMTPLLPVVVLSFWGYNRKLSEIWLPLLLSSVFWGVISSESVSQILIIQIAVPAMCIIMQPQEHHPARRPVYSSILTGLIAFCSASWFHLALGLSNWQSGLSLINPSYLSSGMITALLSTILASLYFMLRTGDSITPMRYR